MMRKEKGTSGLGEDSYTFSEFTFSMFRMNKNKGHRMSFGPKIARFHRVFLSWIPRSSWVSLRASLFNIAQIHTKNPTLISHHGIYDWSGAQWHLIIHSMSIWLWKKPYIDIIVIFSMPPGHTDQSTMLDARPAKQSTKCPVCHRISSILRF